MGEGSKVAHQLSANVIDADAHFAGFGKPKSYIGAGIEGIGIDALKSGIIWHFPRWPIIEWAIIEFGRAVKAFVAIEVAHVQPIIICAIFEDVCIYKAVAMGKGRICGGNETADHDGFI